MIAPTASTKRFSGLYRGSSGEYRLDLRIDIDGDRPAMRVSGDFFEVKGQSRTYNNSFVVETLHITKAAGAARLTGRGRFEHPIQVSRVEVELPAASTAGIAEAILRFIDTKEKVSATYRCSLVSRQFRRIRIEHDRVKGVTPFASADISVAAVPPGRHGAMTVERAFAEAGIDLELAGAPSIVDPAGAGTDAAWSDAELLAAMREHHSIRSNGLAWTIYLLSATKHESPGGLRGVMFDDAKRQGCATFHNEIGNGPGLSPKALREMLRTYVHEIGHCLNLEHPFESTVLNPAPRHDALSWMNLPGKFMSTSSAGADAYWQAFDFTFDARELAHLRHGLHSTIIPGGNRFFSAGTADVDYSVPQVVADDTGLALTIRTPDRVKLGAPVVVELKLARTARGGAAFDGLLHPHFGRTQIHITGPDGKRSRFRPIASHCADGDDRKAALPMTDSAYVGYGRDGFHFDWPGRYSITATHDCVDGSVLVSNTVALAVEAPLDSYDAAACELFLGDEVGQLLAVLGSDGSGLGNGRDAMAMAVDRFPEHRLSDYARLVIGINAARPFKRLVRKGGRTTLRVRPAQTSTAVDALEPLVGPAPGAAARRDPLDPVSLAMVAVRLGKLLRDDGRDDRADAVATSLTARLVRQGVSATTCARIARDITGRQQRRPNQAKANTEQGEAR